MSDEDKKVNKEFINKLVDTFIDLAKQYNPTIEDILIVNTILK